MSSQNQNHSPSATPATLLREELERDSLRYNPEFNELNSVCKKLEAKHEYLLGEQIELHDSIQIILSTVHSLELILNSFSPGCRTCHEPQNLIFREYLVGKQKLDGEIAVLNYVEEQASQCYEDMNRLNFRKNVLRNIERLMPGNGETVKERMAEKTDDKTEEKTEEKAEEKAEEKTEEKGKETLKEQVEVGESSKRD